MRACETADNPDDPMVFYLRKGVNQVVPRLREIRGKRRRCKQVGRGELDGESKNERAAVMRLDVTWTGKCATRVQSKCHFPPYLTIFTRGSSIHLTLIWI